MLPKEKMQKILLKWYDSWNEHCLDDVMKLFHDDVIFEDWTGKRIAGKSALYRAWKQWFRNDRSFRFIERETFIDEDQQKALYRWQLEWASMEKEYKGMHEKREGVDIIHFKDSKIIKKLTFSKTSIEINGGKFNLVAAKR